MRCSDTRAAAVLALLLLVNGCDRETGGAERAAIEAEIQARTERVLERARERIAQRSDSIDDALRPVPLLTGSEERELRRHLNEAQLARARQLGIRRPEDDAELAALQRGRRLVRLADTTEHWVIRELDHSVPYATPDTEALLTEIATRFQRRLRELGLPPLRLEVTSVLRTAETQAALRRINPNAAAGISTHEFGTTLDIAYNSFAAPSPPVMGLEAQEAPWLREHLQQVAVAVVETVAARRSRELQAILGRVLREMQREGKVMVTLERQQPVYHLTVATRY